MATKEFAERQRLYDQGMSDAEIARALGIKANTVTCWRRLRNLPTHRTPELQSRMGLYRLGWSDTRIAAEQGVTKASIWQWRRVQGLAPNCASGKRGKAKRKAKPFLAKTEHPLILRVRKAVGRGLSRDIADDAAAEILLAIVEGKLEPDRIELEARRYTASVLGTFASRFGPFSLDERLGRDEEGVCRLDRIADAGASTWLEEMGATVW